jgi:hypothetical protein
MENFQPTISNQCQMVNSKFQNEVLNSFSSASSVPLRFRVLGFTFR